jgi:DNA repair protein RadC
MEKTKDFRCGHRERVKNRFFREGLSPFVDYEVLELLLFFVIPRRDTKGMAHALIHRFSSLGGVLNASPEELCEISGIGARTAAYLRALLPFAKIALEGKGEETLTTAERLKLFFVDRFAAHPDETIVAAYLNNSFDVLGVVPLAAERFSEGSISVHHMGPHAFSYGAASVVLAHRVKSAIPFPDRDVFDLTHLLEQELLSLGLSLFDVYLISGEKSVSVKDMVRGISQVGSLRPKRAERRENTQKNSLHSMLSLFMSKERAEVTADVLSGKPLSFFLFAPYRKMLEEYPTAGSTLYFLYVVGDLLSYVRREQLRLSPPLLKTADEVGEMFRSILCGRRGEVFCLATFDKDSRLIRARFFAEGTVTAASVPSRAILEEVTETGAYAAAIAHNHPCGTVEASAHDKSVTNDLMLSLRSLGVKFLDHFVVNEKEFCPIAHDVLHVSTDAPDGFYPIPK